MRGYPRTDVGTRWRKLVHAFAPDVNGHPIVESWGILLMDLYDGADRHYHAKPHLWDVLRRLDEVRGRFADPVTAELALWFHDAIYAVPSRANEARSAELCHSFLVSVGADGKCGAAPGMILATKHDGAPCRDQDTALVLDIDLAGFADPWDAFQANNALIRQEFAVYDEPTYRAGRTAFLRGLLARGPIFRVLAELEAPARANIERHIAELAP